ncbi:uncharacterized protein LOC110821550 [Carica papaya]|uniref:uncharacterized protein LOC110821550 n=1 Tax=Carica papaya TaxID=3649 RepID=UPI000B8D03D4|nr:uncharacterized protein LOC110821550 [Carica papaya]
MEVSVSEEELLKVLDSSLSHIKWRLKSAAKRRLEIDVLGLCTGMRPVVMIDYGGKMPELQENLLSFLKFCQKESPIFEHLRVMVIEDMIYLTHVRRLAKYVTSSLNSEEEFHFVDLEQDPPKMIKGAKESSLVMQLMSIQKLLSQKFPDDGGDSGCSSCTKTDCMANMKSSTSEPISSQSSEYIDLSCCVQDTQVTLPTLNGWLLGYPVVYLFGRDHIADAIYNLSTKSLRIFRVLVSRNNIDKVSQSEELMSFSVPYDLSMGGRKEPWAEMFLTQMQSKREECKQTWKSLEMEVLECYPQAIVL